MRPALDALASFGIASNGAARTLFLRGQWAPALREWLPTTTIVQSFRPHAGELERHGCSASPAHAPDGRFDAAICLLTRRRDENIWMLGIAARALTAGGTLVLAGENELGIGRYARDIEAVCGEAESWSKHRCKVLRGTRREGAEAPAEWIEAGRFKPVEGAPLVAHCASFSAHRIDPGSALLAEHLPLLSGIGCDLGAGYGYLSHRILERSSEVVRVDLVEAEHWSLEAAKMNLASFGARARFQWTDVLREPVERGYDWVVMNPPFHQEERTMVEAGIGFIRAAAKALRQGGSLFMVANKRLPYELPLRESFRSVDTVAEDGGYKIMQGSL